MPTPRATAVDIAAIASEFKELGKLTAQVRELIHQNANREMRDAAMAEKVTRLETLPDDIAEIKSDLSDIKDRLRTLELNERSKDGATGAVISILKSPALGWLFGAISIVAALATGRLHL